MKNKLDIIFYVVGITAIIIGAPFAVAVLFCRFIWDYADYLYRVIDGYKNHAKINL